MSFIDARLVESRLREERFDVFLEGEGREPTGFEPQTMKFDQTTEVGSAFSVSVDDPAAPAYSSVSLDFSIHLRKKDDGAKLASYSSKTDAMFRILRSDGVENWGEIPTEAVAGMLSVVYQLAAMRAEDTFLSGGFRGFATPMPAELSGVD